MKDRIEKIKGINEDFMQSTFYEPSSEDEIILFEEKMGISIPESYREFLKLSDGAEIFSSGMLYGVKDDANFKINYDMTNGEIPKELIIIGYWNDKHICYDDRYDTYIFFEYEDYENIEEECVDFNDIEELLDYMIDIATN